MLQISQQLSINTLVANTKANSNRLSMLFFLE